jgi:hypothetical protein
VSWVALGLVDVPQSVREELQLPSAPTGDLREFGPRYAAAERTAWRYARAMATVPDGTRERERLADGWRTVWDRLDRIGWLCMHGSFAPDEVPQRQVGKRLTRRQRLSPRQRHLHNVHCGLLTLELAADAAVAVAVGVALAAPDDAAGQSTVDDALVALARAVDELRSYG